MTGNNSQVTEIIVDTLLQIGERVFEISGDKVITNTWCRNEADQSITGGMPGRDDAFSARLIQQCSSLIDESFSTGKKGYIEYTSAGNEAFGIRILPIHPDKQFLFAVAERLAKPEDIKTAVDDKWKLALDASGDGMWDIDLETNNIFFSARWHNIFGYGSEEIITATEWGEMIHPEDLAKSTEAIGRYFAGKTSIYSAEVRYKCKDGSYRWILSRGVIIARDKTGKPSRFIGVHTDINERKLAEEKFSSLAQLLSKLINNLRDGIIVTDEHKDVIFANQMFCDIYQVSYGPEQVLGENIFDGISTRMHAYIDPQYYKDRTAAILDKKETVLGEEWSLKDGRTLSRDFIPLAIGDNNKGGIWKFRDITEQKSTEKRLRDVRNFYEQILNNIAADIVVFDPQQRYLFINPAAIKNDELRKWLIGKTDIDYCLLRNKPMSIVDRRKEIFDRARDERRSVEWEDKIQTPSGGIEYHLRNNFPVFDEQGNHLMSIGYGLNITDRKVAEEALKTSKDTFASAFDYSGIGMALISMDGKWLDVNNVLCQLTGYSKEELLQLSLKDITYPDDMDNDLDLLRKLRRKEISTYSIERRYVSKKNKIVLALLTISMVWDIDGSPKFLIAQVVDITEKKALELEINKKNTELEATRVSLINKIGQLEELSHIIAHNLRGPAGNIKMLSGALLAKNMGGKTAVENMLSDAFTETEVLSLIQDSSILLMESLSTLMELTEIKLNKEIPYNDCDVALIVKDITNQLHTMIFEKGAEITLGLQIRFIHYPKAYLENILYNLVSNALKYSLQHTPPKIMIATQEMNGRVQIIVKDNGMGIDLDKYGDKVFKLNEVFHQGYDSKGVGLYITKTQIESFGGTIELKSKLNEGCEFIVTL